MTIISSSKLIIKTLDVFKEWLILLKLLIYSAQSLCDSRYKFLLSYDRFNINQVFQKGYWYIDRQNFMFFLYSLIKTDI